jgi:crotonobetainyl-CoA:carnitine CoA-transferase CaiB-like acyl-CoA transferase
VRNDEDWRRLCGALGDPEWVRSEALATAAGRFAAHDEIDEKLAEWTKGMSKRTVASTLQMFGVPAAPMYTASDQLADPHFQVRGYPRWLDQQGIGWMAFEGPAFHASGMKDIDLFQAPLIGEHTREIARDVIGLDEATIEKQIAAGALEITND